MKVTVYLVHRGFQDNDVSPIGVVTYRLAQRDAQEVADALNERLHALRYYEYLASQSNKALSGGAEGIRAADTDEMRARFDGMRDTARKERPDQARAVDFWVTEMDITGDNAEKLTEEIRRAQEEAAAEK